MKKSLLFAATALAMLASCSQNDDLAQAPALDKQGQTAVTFGTYMGRTPTTRAIADAVNGGVTGSITSAQALAQHRGFGVFAYYTADNDYLGTTSSTPTGAITLTSPQASALVANFMYNQKITGTDAETPVWTYSPIKYWPNGNAIADDQDNNAGTDPAVGALGGKVSFFAYAPYVETVGSTGVVAMSAKDYAGNPTITYKVPTDGNTVDLLWGTTGTNGVKAQDGNVANTGNYIVVDPAGTPAWADRPFLVNANLTKMKTTGKVDFNFKHALAKVGGSNITTDPATNNGLQIVLDIDGDAGAETGGTYDNTQTKVTVESITITARSKVDTNSDNEADKYLTATGNQGILDLATGQWTIDKTGEKVTTEKASAAAMTHTIYSPKSATGNATLNTTIAEPASLADGTAAWDGLVEGVLTTVKNVYADEANPLIFIPGTYPELTVSIKYITRTKDANLNKGYTEVAQTITKTVTFASPVKLNKQYNIIMHLGLTSVKFAATVSDWDPDTDGNGDVDDADNTIIYLPINVSD